MLVMAVYSEFLFLILVVVSVVVFLFYFLFFRSDDRSVIAG